MTIQAVAVVAAVACAVGLGIGWRGRSVLAERDQARALAEQSQAAARRAARIQETADAAFLAAQARVATVRRADAAGDGLRVAAAAVAASAPADGCEATANAARVLAELLGTVERAGRDMARIADERGAAGVACERITADKE